MMEDCQLAKSIKSMMEDVCVCCCDGRLDARQASFVEQFVGLTLRYVTLRYVSDRLLQFTVL
jgi:hypothetical protein